MKSIWAEPVPHIPVCKIRDRLVSTYEFFPRLQKLCSALGFNNDTIEKSGRLHLPSETSENNALLRSLSQPQGRDDGRDRIIILSTTVPYEQSWGGYDGLPGQYFVEQSKNRKVETPSDFIRPYLQQYQFAQEHILLGCDYSGNYVVKLPDYLIWEQNGACGKTLRVLIERIAEPNTDGQFVPIFVSGHIVTFPLASHLHHVIDQQQILCNLGIVNPIGKHLHAEFFQFVHPADHADNSNPFASMLLPLMPWIVTHKTPHLAASLVHLRNNFSEVCKVFAATGTDDLRNLLCVAGLEIDMIGFRGRSSGYFVPWQACWKRYGHCYDNIYPLDQDDFLVALNSFRWERDASRKNSASIS